MRHRTPSPTSSAALAARAATIALLAAVAVSLGGCGERPRQPDSVVLVVLDTVRADRLGCLGGTRGLTPRLDGLADESTLFTAAYSHAPWTLPSVASLLTSRIPAGHGAGGRLGSFRSLGDDLATLPATMRDGGLVTGAIVNVQFLTERFGLTRGFAHVDAHVPTSNRDDRRAGPTTDAALAWLGEHGAGPFFLLVHYFDPHLLYDPPQPHRGRFAAPRDRQAGGRTFGMFGELQALRRGEITLTADALERLEKLHDGEVAYVDAQVGRLLDGLARLGLDDRTVVCVVADHGEEFGDHGGFEHGHTLYDELLHVPLLLRVPGQEAPRRVDRAVPLIDVAPTLCTLVGLAPPAGFAGRDLAPLIAGEDGPARPVVSMGNMWGPGGVALRLGDWKLMVDRADALADTAGATARLFHTGADPGEQHDLAGDEPGRARALLNALRHQLATARRDGGEPEAPALTEQERRQLRSLGYVD
jgi:arylsulfatase A-like enzyme